MSVSVRLSRGRQVGGGGGAAQGKDGILGGSTVSQCLITTLTASHNSFH